MADDLTALARAVTDEDATTARRVIDGRPHEEGDEVLQLLAEHASGGSPIATELLVEQLDSSGTIRRFVGSMLLDESSVDDVSQDCLISVAGSIGSFRGGAKVTTWVHRIARHRVVDHLRRQRATSPLPDDDLTPSARMSSMIATRETVRSALAQLPELYREPVVLRDIDGMSYADVAAALDRNLGTVKAQISRGRALVAAALRGGEDAAP